MGYYSEIVICMNKSDYLLGVEWINSIVNSDSMNMLLPKNCSDVQETIDGVIVMHHQWTKWNKLFDDIKPLYRFFKYIGNDRYFLIELGEDGAIYEEGNAFKFSDIAWAISELYIDHSQIIKTIETIEASEMYYIISYGKHVDE